MPKSNMIYLLIVGDFPKTYNLVPFLIVKIYRYLGGRIFFKHYNKFGSAKFLSKVANTSSTYSRHKNK